MPNVVSAYDVEVCRRIKSVYQLRKKELGITTYSLAKTLDVSQSFIAHIMTGRVAVPLRALLQLAEALDTSPENLDPKFSTRFPEISDLNQPENLHERYPDFGRVPYCSPVPASQPMSSVDNTYVVIKADNMGNLLPTNARLFVRTQEATPVANAPVLVETHNETGCQHQIMYADDLPLLNGDDYRIYPVVMIQLCR